MTQGVACMMHGVSYAADIIHDTGCGVYNDISRHHPYDTGCGVYDAGRNSLDTG